MSVTPVPPQPKRREDVVARKGLVGRTPPTKVADELPELIEQRRKRLLSKSLSVSISPAEVEQIGEGVITKSASFVQQTFNNDPRPCEYP